MRRPLAPPDWMELAAEVAARDPRRLLGLLSSGRPVDDKGRYLHWDQMRHRPPPDGLTLDEWWIGTAASRAVVTRPLPFTGIDGSPFRFTNINWIQEAVHRIDQRAGGSLLSNEPGATTGSGARYLASSLVEEAITSSLLEGAATTRRIAKEMLRTARKPCDRGQRMVLNNYLAMQRVEELAETAEPLVPDDVIELHRIITEGTLDDESEAGRLQRPGEERVFVHWQNELVHRPPPVEELPDRLCQLCAFANGQLGEGFLHPVVRAVLLHFWIGYDHPFADGNGRTARALFYWLMLRSGYWLMPYISISTILRKAPGQYVRSYLHTETDSNDVTYFVVHQLKVLERAIDALRSYLARKKSEIAEVERLLRGVRRLNNRQLAVIGKALRDPDACFTIAGHQRLHRVAYESARTDLLGLERLGVLRSMRSARAFEFWPADDLTNRLKRLAAEPRP